jgi:hypothetical protein
LKLDPVQAEFGVLVGAAGDDADVGEAVGVRDEYASTRRASWHGDLPALQRHPRRQKRAGRQCADAGILAELPAFDGPKVIYAAACLLGPDRLSAYQITVR